jgi:hypothetical protein
MWAGRPRIVFPAAEAAPRVTETGRGSTAEHAHTTCSGWQSQRDTGHVTQHSGYG